MTGVHVQLSERGGRNVLQKRHARTKHDRGSAVTVSASWEDLRGNRACIYGLQWHMAVGSFHLDFGGGRLLLRDQNKFASCGCSMLWL